MDQLMDESGVALVTLLDKHMKNVVDDYNGSLCSNLIEKGENESKFSEYNVIKHTLFNEYDIDFQLDYIFNILKYNMDIHDAYDDVRKDFEIVKNILTELMKVDRLTCTKYMDHVANNL